MWDNLNYNRLPLLEEKILERKRQLFDPVMLRFQHCMDTAFNPAKSESVRRAASFVADEFARSNLGDWPKC